MGDMREKKNVCLLISHFFVQVSTPLGTFQPAVGSNSKKLAKMQAATAALQGLGLVEKTIEYITV